MECLLDASFLGKLLVLPANVRLDWKGLPGKNTLAYYENPLIAIKNFLITLGPGVNVMKLFYFVTDDETK